MVSHNKPKVTDHGTWLLYVLGDTQPSVFASSAQSFQHHALGCLRGTLLFALQLLRQVAFMHATWLLLKTEQYLAGFIC